MVDVHVKLPEHVKRCPVLSLGQLVPLTSKCAMYMSFTQFVTMQACHYVAKSVVVFEDRGNYTSTKTAEYFHSTVEYVCRLWQIWEKYSCLNCMEPSDLPSVKNVVTPCTL